MPSIKKKKGTLNIEGKPG